MSPVTPEMNKDNIVIYYRNKERWGKGVAG